MRICSQYLSFLGNFSLDMLVVVMLIKQGVKILSNIWIIVLKPNWDIGE